MRAEDRYVAQSLGLTREPNDSHLKPAYKSP
jgi:hypothetical protein